jgi:hypothetical protein
MFDKLFSIFSKKNEARRGEDHVWLNNTARIDGISRDVVKLLNKSSSVLVVVPDQKTLELIATALLDHKPEKATDAFSREAIYHVLKEPGTLTIALATVLQTGPKISSEHEVETLVYSRHLQRVKDDAICHFVDTYGSRVRVTFHLALDDELLTEYAKGIVPLVQKLDVKPDEAMVSSMLSRSIKGAQNRNKS